jgi:hypothetical protein
VQKTQVYATGGFGPGEQLQPPDGSLGVVLERNQNTFETVCGSWAIFKLTGTRCSTPAKPSTATGSRRQHPLLVVIHVDQPQPDTALLSADRYYPVERFAAKGALILKPNYRGSAGYGAKFRPLNVGNLGLGDYQDVIL